MMVHTRTAVFLVLAFAFGAANCRSDEEKLEWMLENDIFRLVDAKDPQLKIVVTGRGGVGKSTLVNTLVGEKISETGSGPKAVTRSIKPLEVNISGIRVIYVDTPGLGDKDMIDEDILHGAWKHSKDADLFLFCMQMTVRFDRSHIHNIEAIINTFGKNIWKKGLIALTFANEVDKKNFGTKLREWDNIVRDKLKEIIDPEDAEKIPIVPTGFTEPQLPDRPSWVSEFWIQVFRRMTFGGMCHLIVLNKDRISGTIDDAKFTERNPEDQPLITCYMSRKRDQDSIIVYGLLAGLLLSSAVLTKASRSMRCAPILVSLGTFAGTMVCGMVAEFLLGSDTKDIHCDNEVMLQSLYIAFSEEYPEYAYLLEK